MAAAVCKKTMDGLKADVNGVELYAHIYDKHPDVRHYFKGAETWTAAEVLASDRFKKQGVILIGAINSAVSEYPDAAKFKAYCSNLIDRHIKVDVHLDPKLWEIFWTIFLAYLATKGAVDDGTKTAWLEFGKAFSVACNEHLKALGEPHV